MQQCACYLVEKAEGGGRYNMGGEGAGGEQYSPTLLTVQ